MSNAADGTLEDLKAEVRALREEVANLGEMRAQVQYLRDRQAILDCLARYTRAVDRHDWELLRTVYHHDAIADHGWFVGDVDSIEKTLDHLYETKFTSHLHLIANHICEIEGDTAHAETVAVTYCVLQSGEKIETAGWRYVDRLERRNGEWKIAVRTIALDWRGKIEIDAPASLDSASPAGRWDRKDMAYMRPLELSPERRAMFRQG